MVQLGRLTLFCHRFDVADSGKVTGYKLRQKEPKRASVKALKSLNYHVLAAGDSYNDTTMLEEAGFGFLFKAPENVIAEFPQYPSRTRYDYLRSAFVAKKLAVKSGGNLK